MIVGHDQRMKAMIRTFAEYEEGFTVGEESWLGLKQLAELTKVVVKSLKKSHYNVFLKIQLLEGHQQYNRLENGSLRLSSPHGEASRLRLQPTADSQWVRLPGSNPEIETNQQTKTKTRTATFSRFSVGPSLIKFNKKNLILDAGTS